MNLLVTGGAGFIGSNFVHHILNKHDDYKVVNLDLLTYAGTMSNLEDIKENPNHVFVEGNICDYDLVKKLVTDHKIDTIVNFAAESHVDRSIINPGIFIETNAPNSPYSASKASADLLVRSYFETYGLNVNITRCSNNYGPHHFPEKLIPLMITNGLDGENLPIYGDGKNIRDWLHVSDHCAAIDLVIHNGKSGEVYNVGGHNERTNNEIVHIIVDDLNLSKDKIVYVEDRLGHDLRYAIDPKKIETELGWEPKYTFDTGIKETIEWYVNNEAWWRPLKSRAKLGE